MASSSATIDFGSGKSGSCGQIHGGHRFARHAFEFPNACVVCASVRPRFFIRCFVAAIALPLIAASCSSPATTTVVVTPTTNKGLCKLVAPSVIATVLSESMTFPETLIHQSTTECVYRSKQGTGTAVLIRYDTASSNSTFTKSKEAFARRQKLGTITGLGDQAYYFNEQSGQVSVTTVILLKGSLQLLITGSATLDQTGSIARFALNEYEARPSPNPSSR
jgi:hypothetical protein